MNGGDEGMAEAVLAIVCESKDEDTPVFLQGAKKDVDGRKN